MSFLTYALPPTDYNLKNALLWGNFCGHVEKASYGTWGKRSVHVIICVAEFLPIIGQIASLFEMIVVLGCLDGFRRRQAEDARESNEIRLQAATGVVAVLNEGEKKQSYSDNSKTPPSELQPGEKEGEPEGQTPESNDPPVQLPDVVPADLGNQGKTPTISPANSDFSDTPSTDSETPVSIPVTASMQLEKARLDGGKNSCIVA